MFINANFIKSTTLSEEVSSILVTKLVTIGDMFVHYCLFVSDRNVSGRDPAWNVPTASLPQQPAADPLHRTQRRRVRRILTSSTANTNPTPANTNPTPANTNPTPVNTNPTPVNTNPTPPNTNSIPTNNNRRPANSKPTPTNTNPTPANTNPTPMNTNPTPANTNPTPANTNPTPTNNNPTPITPTHHHKCHICRFSTIE